MLGGSTRSVLDVVLYAAHLLFLLRALLVESQPLFGRTMAWKTVDAATGALADGETEVAPLRAYQPWPPGEIEANLLRGSAASEIA